MHSRIFQITTEQVERENYLNENTLEQGDASPIDYCSEIDDDEREQNIACLVGAILPKGMFTRVGTNIIRYNGGMEQWKAETVAMIQEKAAALTADNLFRYSAHRNLEQALVNPLDTAYLFYRTRRDCRVMQTSPTTSCSLSADWKREHCFISEGLSTIIFNLKTDNDNERDRTIQKDNPDLFGRTSKDGRTFRRDLCQREQEHRRLHHIHSQPSEEQRLQRLCR